MQLKYLTSDTSRLLSKKSEFNGWRRSSTFLISCTKTKANNDDDDDNNDDDDKNDNNNNNNNNKFAKKVMGYWRTRMRLHTENKLIETEDKNTVWNISRGLTITTAILYMPTPSH